MIGIRSQLALLVGIFVSVALVAISFVAAAQDRREKEKDLVDDSALVLDLLSQEISGPLALNDEKGLTLVVPDFAHNPHGVNFNSVAIYDRRGTVLLHAQHETPSFLRFVDRGLSSQELIHEFAEDELWIGEPVVQGAGIRQGTIFARVSLARMTAAAIRARTRLLGGALALAALLVLGLFVGLARTIVRPLRDLDRKAALLAQGKLEERIHPRGGRELRDLADTLNRMAASLQANREELERKVEERTRDLREANVLLEKLAVTDGLTGVFNHRRFAEGLEQEVLRAQRSNRPLSVLMIDVDHFKKYNDRFGHPAGDELLINLARTLQAELRATDILARYGGEEFAVILPETAAELAAQVAERVRLAVDTRLNGGDREHHVSISVGVSTRKENEPAEALLRKADEALYRAKNSGRNRVSIAA